MKQEPLRFGLINEKWIVELRKFYPEAEYIHLSRESLAKIPQEVDILLLVPSELELSYKENRQNVRPSIFLIVEESDPPPVAYLDGRADELLIFPLRNHDLIRAVRTHRLLHELRKLEETSGALPELIKALQEDITMAQKIQRHLIKEKFTSIDGLKIKSKYHCGLKSGGDYFDIFELDQNSTGILMTNSSSYHLSSLLIGALIQFPKFKQNRLDPQFYLNFLWNLLAPKIKKNEQLHFFFGILNTKTFQIQYINYGDHLVCKRNGISFNWLSSSSALPLSLDHVPGEKSIHEINLDPGDRLAIFSNGWNVSLEDFSTKVPELLAATSDMQGLVNEISFSLHKKLNSGSLEDDESPMPEQDCSILLFDMTKNVLRLAT